MSKSAADCLGGFEIDAGLRFVRFERPGNEDRIGQSVWSVLGRGASLLLSRALRRVNRQGGIQVETAVYQGVRWTITVAASGSGYTVQIDLQPVVAPEPEPAPVDAVTPADLVFVAPTVGSSPLGAAVRALTSETVEDVRNFPGLLCLLSIPEGRLRQANPAWQRVLGYSPEALEDRFLTDLVLLDDHAVVIDALARPDDGAPRKFTCRVRALSGEIRYIQWSAAPGHTPGHLYAAAWDVTEHRVAEEAVRRQIYKDPLTGLNNRRYLEEKLAVAIAENPTHPVAVLFVDLDRFKPINDALGHDIGDQVLQVVARRLENTLRAEDTVVRLGGDEFVALLPRIAAPADAALVAQKLLEALRAPCQRGGHDIYLSASIGIAVAPLHGRDAQTLIKKADTAMYVAKREGRSGFAVYEERPEVGDTLERLQLESRLGQAVERGEMRLHYQPQVDAATGKLNGFEALLRWQPEGMGLVPAGAFLPIAEELGLLGPMGEWALDEACRQASEWARAIEGLSMSINLSARQLNDPNLAEKVLRVLKATNLPPEKVELELTETALARDDENVRQTLKELRDMGIRLCVDDFGTGYANFAYLTNLRLDRLKIDRSLVAGVTESEKDAAVVRAVVDLAHTLGMTVVAEGVETQVQYDRLVELGCDVLQGYYFGKPLPPAEIPRLLSARETA